MGGAGCNRVEVEGSGWSRMENLQWKLKGIEKFF